MGYFKEACIGTFEVSPSTYFEQSVPEAIKSTINTENLKESINTLLRHLETYKFDETSLSAEDIESKIHENASKLQYVKFPMFVSDIVCRATTLIRECATILYLVDSDIEDKRIEPSTELLDKFMNLKFELCENSNKWINYCTCNGGYFAQTISDCIKHFLYPYFKVTDTTSEPINTCDLCDILFNPKSILNRAFYMESTCEVNDIDYSRKWNVSHEYGPYGDLITMLSDNIDSAPDKIKDIFYKTYLIMYLAIQFESEYLYEIQDLAKYYLGYINGEYQYDVDSFGVVEDGCLPKTYQEFLPYTADSYEFTSTEAEQIMAKSDSMAADAGVNGISIDKIDQSYKNKFLKFQKTITDIFKVKGNKLKAKINSGFFKRWFGRIPSMLSTYGGSAMVRENRMKGDPTQILLSSGVEYLQNMTSETEAIFNELIVVAKKVASGGDIQAKLSAVKNFCKQYPIEDADADPKTVKRQITNEACFRIANAILQENGVYGYTADGIVENHKFPTCNHIVVSLFVENAQEKAEDQPVSNIFQNPDSITVFAHPEKLNGIEAGYRKATSSIMSSFNPKIVSTVHKNLNQNYKMFASNITKRANVAAGQNGDAAEDIKQSKAVAKAIDDGIVDALDIVIEQKKRCIQCVGSMYDMSGRIMELAKRCVSSLHEEEKRHADDKFKSGVHAGDLNRNTKGAKAHNQRNEGYNKALAKEKEMQERIDKRKEMISSGELRVHHYV